VNSHFPAHTAGFCELTEEDVARRVISDEEPWNVTIGPLFYRRRDLPFVACSRIEVQATNGRSLLSAKGAETQDDP
jgi:hypothetical protein